MGDGPSVDVRPPECHQGLGLEREVHYVLGRGNTLSPSLSASIVTLFLADAFHARESCLAYDTSCLQQKGYPFGNNSPSIAHKRSGARPAAQELDPLRRLRPNSQIEGVLAGNSPKDQRFGGLPRRPWVIRHRQA